MIEEFSFLVDKMFKIKEKFFILLIFFISVSVSFSSSKSSLQNEDTFTSAKELSNLLQNYLKNQGIDSYPSIDTNKKFKSCGKHLKFFPVFKSWTTVEIVCGDPNNNWKIFVRTRAHVDYNYNDKKEKLKNKIVFSNKSLLKGHIIRKSDLELSNAKKNVGAGIFNNIEDLVGRKLKQNVSLGFPIRSRHLHLEWVINKGDKVDIIQSTGGIIISASGVALENGQKGEKIKVMNLSSEKKLVAWVINEKKVSIQAKINSN
tara:strand:+ start:1539 stop:2318 length:780 start_codon:yes stop_codon:yes gene_type:complete